MPDDEARGSTPYDRLVRVAETQLFETLPAPDLPGVAEAAGIPIEIANELFPDRDTLSVAIIENALIRLTDFLSRRTACADPDDPVLQFKALTSGFVDWALENTVSAAILTERSAAVERGMAQLSRYDSAINSLAGSLLGRAAAEGRLADGVNIQSALFHGRAITLGLTRMVAGTTSGPALERTEYWRICHEVINQFFDGLFRRPDETPVRTDA